MTDTDVGERCPVRSEGDSRCEHWWDGGVCCACGSNEDGECAQVTSPANDYEATNTELQRRKRGDPSEPGWYITRIHVMGEWCCDVDWWLGTRGLVKGWGSGANRDMTDHLPLRLETCLEPEP